jgi:hypothetical protein
MIKINLRNVYLWSARFKIIVILGTSSIIFVLGYFFCLRGHLEIREKEYLNLLALKKKSNEQLKIAVGPSYQKEVKNLKDKFDIYVNDQIDKHVSHILSGQLISPTIEIDKNLLISLKGKNYLLKTSDFIQFLNSIASINKFILLKRFKWSILNIFPYFKRKNIFFLFKVYSFNTSRENLILALSKKKLNIKFTLEKDVLLQYSLKKIKMIGFYAYNEIKKIGFIQLPNKKIYKIQLGDLLGKEQGLVIGIYDKNIFILNKNFKKITRLSIDNRELVYV